MSTYVKLVHGTKIPHCGECGVPLVSHDWLECCMGRRCEMLGGVIAENHVSTCRNSLKAAEAELAASNDDVKLAPGAFHDPDSSSLVPRGDSSTSRPAGDARAKHDAKLPPMAGVADAVRDLLDFSAGTMGHPNDAPKKRDKE